MTFVSDVLARRNDASLMTNDGKLAELCRKLNVECII
jgi:predicted nucleic acid-binding protein